LPQVHPPLEAEINGVRQFEWARDDKPAWQLDDVIAVVFTTQ
jgi:hypothetical protein